MRKLVVGTLFVFVAVLFVAPAFAGTVLKFSSIHEPAHPSAYTADFFAQRVNQMTNGELDVQVYHSRQLGETLRALREPGVELGRSGRGFRERTRVAGARRQPRDQRGDRARAGNQNERYVVHKVLPASTLRAGRRRRRVHCR